MADSLTILMPTYQNQDQLYTSIFTLMRYAGDYPIKVLIINNDPSRSSRKPIEDMCAPTKGVVEVMHMHSNTGWMGAINAGLAKVTTPLVCFCNDDVLWPGSDLEFWDKLTSHFDDPKTGAVGPSSNYVMGWQNVFTLKVPDLMFSTLLIGFCVVMRTQMIKDIGGLDETLPGGDDLDWSIRIRPYRDHK